MVGAGAVVTRDVPRYSPWWSAIRPGPPGWCAVAADAWSRPARAFAAPLGDSDGPGSLGRHGLPGHGVGVTFPRRRGGSPSLAVVVPVYGNEGSLPELYRRIVASVDGLGFEFVLSSSTTVPRTIPRRCWKPLAAADSRVRVLLLSRNHGSFTAIAAGLAETADCAVAVILSADLQDPPEMIPAMATQWRAGKKVVLCSRRDRQDPGMGKFFSQAFHWLYRKAVMPEMPPGGFDFCLIDRRVVQVLLQASEKRPAWSG